MTKSSNEQQIFPLIKELQNFAVSQAGSMIILRSLGYGLLLLALFDVVEILIPPNLMNPVWEFNAFGSIVDRVPVPLIGLALIFYGNLYSRGKWELLILKPLSWLTLLLTIIFLLSIPLGISNTIRLSRQSNFQVNSASQQQISQAEQIAQQVRQATPEQIDNFFKAQKRTLDNKNTQEKRQELLSQVSQIQEQIKTKAQATQSSRNLTLVKSSVKWNLGALVATVLFFIFWKTTKWARVN
jgi:hypothetical protein